MMRKMIKSMVSLVLIVTLLALSMPAFAATTARIMKVNTQWTRFHKSPLGSGEVARLRKGTKLLYWGEKAKDNNSMYKVMNSNGKIGYVYKAYLSTYGAMKTNQVYVTTGRTNLYKRSGGTLKGNGTLARGKYVVVYKTSGNWAYIKTMSGKSAYCLKSMLKRAF